jgi:hypothetical protein
VKGFPPWWVHPGPGSPAQPVERDPTWTLSSDRGSEREAGERPAHDGQWPADPPGLRGARSGHTRVFGGRSLGCGAPGIGGMLPRIRLPPGRLPIPGVHPSSRARVQSGGGGAGGGNRSRPFRELSSPAQRSETELSRGSLGFTAFGAHVRFPDARPRHLSPGLWLFLRRTWVQMVGGSSRGVAWGAPMTGSSFTDKGHR